MEQRAWVMSSQWTFLMGRWRELAVELGELCVRGKFLTGIGSHGR